MACGGCGTRRAAIVAGAKAFVRGDVDTVKAEAARFVGSGARDVRRAAQAAAHLRLKRR
jgi:hypothetical protein